MRLVRNILALLLAALLILLLFLPVLVVAGLLGYDGFIYRAGRLVIRAAFWTLGVKTSVRGLAGIDFSLPPVIVCNHLSNLDGPLLMTILPVNPRVLIKAEVRRMPLVGWMFKLADFVFVDRSSPLRRQEALEEAIAKIQRKKYSFLVFPEGTRSRDGAVADFKKGGFVIAQRAGVPVLPVRISGTYRLWPPGRKTCAAGRVEVEFFPLQWLQGVDESGLPAFIRGLQKKIYTDNQP